MADGVHRKKNIYIYIHSIYSMQIRVRLDPQKHIRTVLPDMTADRFSADQCHPGRWVK